MTTPTASAAGARVSASPTAKSPSLWSVSMVIMNSSGATARSWASRTAKLKRPIGADSSLFSASTGTTIAVDDSEKAAPKISAAAGFWPNSAAAPAIAAVLTTTCARPRPNTSLRRLLRRSKESSSPIVKSSTTTPKAASRSIASTLVIASASSQGARAAKRPRPNGPSATPASR